jgi:choice-of-anchor B domain-containing protein
MAPAVTPDRAGALPSWLPGRYAVPFFPGGPLLRSCLVGTALFGLVVLAPSAHGSPLQASIAEGAADDGPGQTLGATPCVSGMAGIYPCRNVDLMAFLPIASIGGGSGSDIWGWTDPVTGHEWAILGRSNGTSFVDITDAANPVYVGNLLTHTGTSSWREIKTYGNYVYIVSDDNGAHGLQIFDMTRLRNVANPPVTFTAAQADGHYSGFGRCHDVAVDTQSGFLYCVGTDTYNGSLHIVDLSSPTNPTFAGSSVTGNAARLGYIHDTQCVVYHGPDVAHQGKQICFAANSTTSGGTGPDRLAIIDVTNKAATRVISARLYPGSGFIHQGWLTEDHRSFLVDDELDEQGFGHNTKTYMWDLLDLDAPVFMGFHLGPTTAIDHNQFIKGHYSYQANYAAGLRILDLTNLPSASLTEVAYFDIVPSNNNPSFSGAWGVYPFFASGNVIVSGISGASTGGLFVLRPNLSADFSLSAQPATLGVCGPAAASGAVAVTPSSGYAGAVTFGATGLPSGATAAFAPAATSVPGSTEVTVWADAVAPGSYPFSVTATDGTLTRQASAMLSVSASVPPAPTPTQPANGASDQPLRPSFTWQPAPGATGYDLQIASSPSFTTIVQSATGLGTTTHTAASELATNTTYYWRVRTATACGEGPYSAPRSFTTTAPLAGCPLGTTAQSHFRESFEGRPRGWTHAGPGDTWLASPARAHDGTLAMHAADTPSVSDQRLVSPAVTLPPATQSPVTLQFWNWQDMESEVPGRPDAMRHVGCRDGAVLEVSDDAGATWTPLETQLLTDPSDGQIGTGTGNPLAGLGAWCGHPQDWLNSVADLTAWAGRTVRFRFRLGTDEANGREGWYVDELNVQSCVPNPTPTLAISDVTGDEPDQHEHSPLLTFLVSLSAPSAEPVTVEWSTADGMAVAGLDYEAAAGTVTFPPGSTSQLIDVEMLADALVEPPETFLVTLGRPVGATLDDDQGVGTILDQTPEQADSRPR